MSEVPRWLFVFGTASVALVFASCTLTRAGYKSPNYSLKERIGDVEIREYPSLVLAETPSKLSSEGKDGGFMRLFRFISKGNASAKALPMTTPVFYRGAEGAQSMAFVMPEGLSHESVPAPLDSAVRVMARKGGNFAVLRIRGGRGDASRARAQERLKAALNGAAWRPEGEPEFAFYDPPWIPSFLERNEVLWRVVRTFETHGPR